MPMATARRTSSWVSPVRGNARRAPRHGNDAHRAGLASAPIGIGVAVHHVFTASPLASFWAD